MYNYTRKLVAAPSIPMTDDDVPALLKAIILQWLIDVQKDEHAVKGVGRLAEHGR